jgi:hypothetical protein
MAIIKIDGFDFFDDLEGNPKSLILNQNQLEEQIQFVISEQIKSIALSYWYSKGINSLEFLINIPNIQNISISDMDLDYTPLSHLVNLKSAVLDITKKFQMIDFECFDKLEELSIDWFEGFIKQGNFKKLKKLTLRKFKLKPETKEIDFLPDSINSIEITESNINSFSGLKKNNLNQLEAYYCPKLVALSGLQEIKESLKILIIENAKNLLDFEDLWECENLEKIILTNCGTIPSLKNLPKLKKLKMFTFYNTTIEDGDLTNLFNVEYVYFKNQKHYNHKYKEFEKNGFLG